MFKGIYYLFFPERHPDWKQELDRRQYRQRQRAAQEKTIYPWEEALRILNAAPTDNTLRKEFPAVMDAWEKYQMLIKLHGGLREDERSNLSTKVHQTQQRLRRPYR